MQFSRVHSVYHLTWRRRRNFSVYKTLIQGKGVAMAIQALLEQISEEFRERGGILSDEEWRAVDQLVLAVIPPYPRIPRPLFNTVMSRNVPVTVEIVGFHPDRGVFFVHGDNEYGKGLHAPGSYITPGERVDDAVRRCAHDELGVGVKSARPLGSPINHVKSPRFHDFALPFICEFDGEPRNGEWNTTFPKTVPKYEQFREFVEPLLKK